MLQHNGAVPHGGSPASMPRGGIVSTHLTAQRQMPSLHTQSGEQPEAQSPSRQT